MRTVFACLLLSLFAGCVAGDDPPPVGPRGGTITPDGPNCADGPGEVFERRIQPLLDAGRDSSCTKCHAAGVSVGAFVNGDGCASMHCLIEQQMVDLESPEDSWLLALIARGFDPAAETSARDEMAVQEYQGFLEWIEWASICQDACAPLDGSIECALPETPLAEPRETVPNSPPPLDLDSYPCTEQAQARAFRDYIFPTQSRCGHCHAVNGAIAGIADAPTWLSHQRTVAGSMRTIRNLYSLGAINLDEPRKSKVVLKPLSENIGGVEHGGGGKFASREDPLYLDLVQWISMQAQCRLVDAVPTPAWPTDKLRDTYGSIPYASQN